MKQTKMIVLAIIVLLVLGALQYLPSVKGQGSDNSLVNRVAVLEALVDDLNLRVEYLEQGQVPPETTFNVLHLNPHNDGFPDNPSNGDLCVVLTEWDWAPDEYAYVLYCYLNNSWFPSGNWFGAAGGYSGGDPGGDE